MYTTYIIKTQNKMTMGYYTIWNDVYQKKAIKPICVDGGGLLKKFSYTADKNALALHRKHVILFLMNIK